MSDKITPAGDGTPGPDSTPEAGPSPRTDGSSRADGDSGRTRAPRRRGRRPAGEDTRAQILASARELFTTEGYDKASLRAIARRAGVDPALVHHYFDGKAELFIAAVTTVEVNPVAVLGGLSEVPVAQLGETIVRTFLELWDAPGARDAFTAILRAAISPDEGIRPFREFVSHEILRQIPVPEDDAALRVLRGQLIAQQLLGLALGRYVVQLDQLATLPAEDLVALLGPAVQRCVDGELPATTAP